MNEQTHNLDRQTEEKGFVTVATGSEEYYLLAKNLLDSYLYFSKKPMPFSIITDKGNKQIDGFDKVIILDNPQNNTLDKLEILDKSPYKETIFIDSDCLAYDDLNRLWEYFLGCDDISTLGDIVSLEDKASWFDKSTVGEFSEIVEYSLRIHGGVYFIRKGSVSYRIKQLCKYISDNFDKFSFRVFPDFPVDETLLSLAMTVEHLIPIPQKPEIIDYFPSNTWSDIDIKKRKASYKNPWISGIVPSALLVHFGHYFTKQSLYNCEVYKLRQMIKGKRIFVSRLIFIRVKYYYEKHIKNKFVKMK